METTVFSPSCLLKIEARRRDAAENSKSGRYMPQLDSLRALAVFAVMFNHFLPGNPVNVVAPGTMGVLLFFALSGFLITGILLRCRDGAIATGRPRSWVLRQFYIRRFLRICPIYYFVLACAFLIGIPPVRETILWHLTYTTNFLIALKGHWVGPFTHFWTLGVEEQYYLAWPWVILFLPRKWLLPAILCSIVVSPIYALIMMVKSWSDFFYLLPFSSLRTLGVGALLGFCYHYGDNYSLLKNRLCRFGLFIGAPMFVTVAIFGVLGYTKESSFMGWFCHELIYLASLTFFIWLIDRAASGFRGTLGNLMENRQILYLGKISYGIYVYHEFMPWLMSETLHRFGFHFAKKESALQFVLLVVLSIVAAALSWHFLERPLNNLKSKFKYA